MSDTTFDCVVGLQDVSVDYGAQRVLDSLCLDVQRGEFIALLGPSGSGKTTALRTVAGFIEPREGTVTLSGKDVTHVPPHKRGVGVVFQNYALFPHMTVENNIAYAMHVRKWGRQRIKQRCQELLELVQLTDHARKKPAKLSGGQQQRVALARALAMDPEVLLLDEPLSNLDANLRRAVGNEIRRLQRETETTAIMVTHDRHEAFAMADKIAVLRDGKIEQLGEPHEIYRTPTSRFMATFGGEANLVPGVVRGPGAAPGVLLLDTPLGTLEARGDRGAGERATVLVRPEDLRLEASTGGGTESGVITACQYGGATVMMQAQFCDLTVTSVVSGGNSPMFQHGAEVVARVAAKTTVLLPDGEQ